jgi:hypothetical protein
LLADYGRSIIRPIIALIASFIFFHSMYSEMLMPNAIDKVAFTRAVYAFTMANSVPFVGALSLDKDTKTALICGNPLANAQPNKPECPALAPTRLQALALTQSALSGLLFFFIALALRNYFKLR